MREEETKEDNARRKEQLKADLEELNAKRNEKKQLKRKKVEDELRDDLANVEGAEGVKEDPNKGQNSTQSKRGRKSNKPIPTLISDVQKNESTEEDINNEIIEGVTDVDETNNPLVESPSSQLVESVVSEIKTKKTKKTKAVDEMKKDDARDRPSKIISDSKKELNTASNSQNSPDTLSGASEVNQSSKVRKRIIVVDDDDD